MDGDGDIDVLSTAMEDDRIYWYENNGIATFTPHIIYSYPNPTGWLPFSVSAHDVDGDGDMDALSGGWFDPTVRWYENDGNQNFTLHIITNNAGDWPSSVWGADVDSDGDIDVLSPSLDGDEIAWYENSLLTTGVETRATVTPEQFTLQQSGFVTLKVFNLLGQEVATVLQEHKPAGSHTVNFDASALASGLYYYTLTAGGSKQSRKLLLLR